MSATPLRRALTFTSGLVVSVCVGLMTSTPAAVAAPVSDPKLATALTKVMSDSRVQRATSGAAVADVASGSLLYGRNADRGLTPASNTKLFTAAAAMKTLGPGFRFRTEVIRRATVRTGGLVKGNLYLKGYGDPTTMQSDYAALARQVKAAGVRTVTGRLAVDTSYFDTQAYNPHWSTGYADDYYAAQIRALTLAPNTDYDSGTVYVNYTPGSKGRPATITTTPAAAARAITIRNLTTTGTRATSVSVSRAWNSSVVTVRGTVRAGGSTGSAQIAVDRPDLVAAAVFRAELSRVGVKVLGPTTSMTVPSTLRHRVAVDYSIPLSQLLVPFLKFSNNMHAETLTKTMGRVVHGSGSWSSGLAVTRADLVSFGVPMTGVKLVDGSGLTRDNTITPRAMVALLTRVQRQSWFKAYYDALPVAGDPRRLVGGTMASRLVGTKAAKNAHAKTGSLTGVTALSGYVTGANGRFYAFSMISNYRTVTPRPVENTLVATLAAWK